MTLSILDQRVRFRLAAPLPRTWQESLGQIPGVTPWYGAVVEAPLNAHDIVRDILTRWGVAHTMGPVRLPQPVEVATVREHLIRNTEAHEWLWEEDAARVPTAGFALKAFQAETIAFGCARGAANYWLPPGAGKTIIAILTALVKPGPILVVTQANAREQHRRETERCTTVKPYVILPSGDRRKGDRWHTLEEYHQDSRRHGFRPMVIVGWEQLRDFKARLRHIPFETVIWDEAHKGKFHKREKWVTSEDGKPSARKLDNTVSAAYELASAIPRRFSTTATPIRNRLIDLFMQMNLIEPGQWGRTGTRYAFRYCDAKPGEFGGLEMVGTSNIPELKHRLSYSTIVVPHAVTHAQLPEKRRMVVRVAPKDQQKVLARSKEEAAAERAQEKLKGPREKKLKDAASAKRGAVKDLCVEHLRSGNGKVMVLTGRVRDAEQLATELERRLKIKTWLFHGGIPMSERQAIQDAYMGVRDASGNWKVPPHPGPCLIVATRQSIGQSLNFQDTDAQIHAMLPDTPGEVDQGEGRVSRQGQKRPVLIIYPIATDTYDEDVLENILSKFPAVEDVAGGGSMIGFANTLMGLDRKDEILKGLAGVFDTDNEWGIP